MTSAATRRQLKSHYDVVEGLPEATVVTFHNVNWDGYEKLLAQVGEASGLRISYDAGEMQVMSLSTEHETYGEFISHLISHLSLRLRIDIPFFGSATIKRQGRAKGKEPDGCFYVQSAARIGSRVRLDFEIDPPPDVAIEIDIHHDARDKFTIYAALGVPEVWRYDGKQLTIHLLQRGRYVKAAISLALPMLTAARLTELLTQRRQAGEYQALLTFYDWLQTLPSSN